MSDGRPTYTPTDFAAAYHQKAATNTTPIQVPRLRPRPQLALYDYAYLGYIRSAEERRLGEGSDDLFDRLYDLAEDEDWDGLDPAFNGERRILRRYAEQTFERVHQQNKVLTSPDGRASAFNIGLMTPAQDYIYGLFEPNRKEDRQAWYFCGWRVESDRSFLDTFPDLPLPATYFDDPLDYFYDWTAEVVTGGRLQHIVEDNIDRFPAQLRSEGSHGLALRLDGAVNRAKRRVGRNYKAAVPMWYPQAGRIQFLLPLDLIHPGIVDMALVVSKHGNRYLAETVLTMGMAYNNARLLAKPDLDWLRPTPVEIAETEQIADQST